MSTVTVPQWNYHDQNIQGNVEQSDFTRSDRVMIYAAPSPLPGQTTEIMKAVGLINSYNHNEQKQLNMLFELGSSVPMIIPGLTQGQISLARVLINGMNLLNTLYHGSDVSNISSSQILRSIRDINRPLDIMIAKYPVLDGDTSAQAIETILFNGCQIQSRGESITAGGVVVYEQMNLMYAKIAKATFKGMKNG